MTLFMVCLMGKLLNRAITGLCCW